MDLNIVIKPSLTQRLTFTQFFNLSLKVLQLNHHDLTEHILASANENPLLEVEVTESDFGYSSYKTEQNQEWFDESFSLTDYLIDQARLIKGRNDKLLEYCIYLIDERGYFNEDIKKVALENSVSESEVEAVVLEIQQLEPLGVGARDLGECLLIQAKKFYPDFKLLETIINQHLYDVAENNIAEIEMATGVASDEILGAITILKRLNPIPGNGFEFKKSEYIIPEFEVIKTAQDNLEIKLFYNWKINLNQDYKKQLDLVTSQEKELLNKYLNEGKQLINAVSKRQDSLQRIVTKIVKHQQAYLINNQPLKRLRLVDLSRETNLHVSTVCRVIKDKYYLMDNQVSPIASLLSKGTKDASVSEIKMRMSKIIRSETKDLIFYSDEKIKQLLLKQGIDVSRRVVTKYRQELGYPTSYERRSSYDFKG